MTSVACTPILLSTASDEDIIRAARSYRTRCEVRGREPPARVVVPLRAPALFKDDSDIVEARVIFYGSGPVVERGEEDWR